ncbi:M20 aminoacylase family protein [Pontibacterium granulatum]|uniref:M20 aminoacylase family protein n=1 Tax=Pontibacterium granulatum TaxID=2036029 RepID=UPI00249A4062|nr:M20 aminoacylase family protein [Pontibacterium granulatum]MDI3324390.1 M20 aminoacylase family protein [Pontibacterium granulatum]
MTELIAQESELHVLMREWRRDLHAHPETAFEEHRTAAKVADLLRSFGLQVHTGLAETGVVATLTGNTAGTGMIGLRADMDALNIQELNRFSHCSRHKGKMHGCGHDGHTAMLLGAAKYLAGHRDFAGTVVFIFQPAEEGKAGARLMCEQGLFEQFPVDAVYGMHNWPGLGAGEFAVHQGPVMAAMDLFDIQVTGNGCHAGMPHMGVDPVVVAGQLIGALQGIVSRNLSPLDSGVVSVTQMHGGDAYNVVPDSVTLSGTCRTFCEDVRTQIRQQMATMVEHFCSGYGATGTLDYRAGYPATVNDPEHATLCADIAASLVGNDKVHQNEAPSMGAEDFSFMLKERPGAYIWIGNGSAEDGRGLHNPYYDFNDEILPLGASYWVALVQGSQSVR